MRARIWSLATASAFALLTGLNAHAEGAAQPAAAPAATTLQEVVVTGTQLRGVAPAGAEVLGLKTADIQAVGAPTTNQLLSNVPQIANQFNSLPVLGTTTVSQIQVTRLNLRDLPGLGVQSGNSTLLLVDGHRIASAGVNQFAPDADVVPPGVIDRVEIVPDGGSSIYGSDAVGGVINLITKKHVDGVHVDVRGGFAAGGYHTINTDLSAGKAWDSGSAYIDWDFAKNSTLLNRERSYSRNIDWTTGIPIGRQCTPPNVTTGGVNYAAPGLQPNTVSACDRGQFGSLYPEQKRNSIFAGVTQELSAGVTLDVRAFYTERNTDSDTGPVQASATVTSGNPFYIQIPGTTPGAPQSVQFNWSDGRDTSHLKEWGITPTITADLGHEWQVRGMLNVGGSHSQFRSQSSNPTLLGQYAAGTTTQTAINPYDITATPNQQLLANVLDYAQQGESFVKMTNMRAIADGPLFTLPGGQVRLAAGVEYLSNNLRTRNAGSGLSATDFAATNFQSYSQEVKSAFGELQIPIVGPGNAVPGIQALNVSASLRYDSYNDFGNTTNPKIGVTWEPVDWITLRGSWSKSFNAPTPVDQLGSLANSLLIVPAFFVAPPGRTPPAGSVLVALQGSQQNLQPQTAKQYSVGGDFRWPFLQGLKSSITYYNIDYNGLLGKPPVFNAGVFFANFPNFYVIQPTNAQVAAFAAQAKGGLAQVAQYIAPGAPTSVFTLIDFRTANLGSAVARGLDFSTQYRRDTEFGGWDLSVNGNYELKNTQQLGPGLAITDNLTNITAFRIQVTAGVDYGQLRAQLTMNHNGSYKLAPTPSIPQDSVGAFTVFNLFFRYAMPGEDWRKNLSFTVNVDNLFDTDPPVYRASSSNGYANGSTLGRLVQFGVHKDF